MVLILPRNWYFALIVLASGVVAINEGWSRLHPAPAELACADFGKQSFSRAPPWIRVHDCVLDYSSYLEPYSSIVGIRVFASRADALNGSPQSLFILSADNNGEIDKIKHAASKYAESRRQGADISGVNTANSELHDSMLVETDLDLEAAEYAGQLWDASHQDPSGGWGNIALQRTAKPAPEPPSRIAGVLMILVGIATLFSLLGVSQLMRKIKGE